ncbi:MAG TPA: TonB-dependent receptor, partial [Puia sp.]|nr:TonB-dependent receptor [Puia sp.]
MKVLPGYALTVLAAMILLTKNVCGQITLTGAVRDTAKVFRVPANLRLRNDSGGAIWTVLADSSGHFLFQGLTAGKYSIQCSYANVIGGRARLNLGKDTFIVVFVSGRDPTLLKAAVVTGSKPLLERKIDRMVFNVENSIAARGTNLLQALELTPLLTVSDRGISIVGKGGVSIMINGRLLPLRGSDLVNYLSSLRSDDVSSIEVITTPPARYEAQGNSGLINIVLKKNPNMGWSGNASSTYEQATYPSIANNGSLNYRSPALTSSLKLRQFHRMQAISEEIDINDQDPILSSNSRKVASYGLGANLSMEYKLNKRSDIGFIYDVGKSTSDTYGSERSSYLSGTVIDSVLNTLSTHKNPTLTQTLNAYYDHKLDSMGKVMSFGLNYLYNTPNSTLDFRTASDESSVADTIRSINNFAYGVWSLQCDLTLPYRWVAVETGAKFTDFNDHSQVGYYNLFEKTYTMDSSKSNSFRYDEKNIAGYL